MGEIIVRQIVKRDPAYFYYVSKDGDLCRAQITNRGRKKNAVEPAPVAEAAGQGEEQAEPTGYY